MQRRRPRATTAETPAEEVPALFWLLLIAAVAAVSMVTISTVRFDGFDRLLRDGGLFAPYFTT
jgi:hypothetical protein